MYQLKNLIHRKAVPSDPSKNMNASEDFLLLLLHTHVVASAEAILSYIPLDSVSDLSKVIVATFVHLTKSDSDDPGSEDLVHLYAKELLSLCLLWHGYHDSIREGDGERILRYWKFLLIIFKVSNKYNYAKEAVNLLLQYYYILSERQKSELLWNRCINTRGAPGANIPCDLHMEHLNRRLKTVLRNLAANIKPSQVEKAGKSISAVQHVCEVFEAQTSPCQTSQHHPYPSFGKDFNTILKVLEEENVFTPSGKRQHKSFNFNCGLLAKLKKIKKIQTNIDQLY